MERVCYIVSLERDFLRLKEILDFRVTEGYSRVQAKPAVNNRVMVNEDVSTKTVFIIRVVPRATLVPVIKMENSLHLDGSFLIISVYVPQCTYKYKEEHNEVFNICSSKTTVFRFL